MTSALPQRAKILAQSLVVF